MSGFLQRITGAAIQRQSRLHPVVDSVYAAARRDETPAFQLTEASRRVVLLPQEDSTGRIQSNEGEQVSPASRAVSFEPSISSGVLPENARRRRSEGSQETATARSDARHWGEMGDSSAIENSILNLLGSGAFQPLLGRFPVSQREDEAAAEMHSERNLSEIAGGYNAANAVLRGFNLPSDFSAEAREGSGAWRYAPIVTAGRPTPSRSGETSQGPRPSEPERSAAALLTASRRAAASEAAAQRNAQIMRPPLQAEEIQIHIGRIEVIAVPPPATRSAAAPARKGQSLDEYLSRSNGRSR
jgi:hypothetical protein